MARLPTNGTASPPRYSCSSPGGHDLPSWTDQLKVVLSPSCSEVARLLKLTLVCARQFGGGAGLPGVSSGLGNALAVESDSAEISATTINVVRHARMRTRVEAIFPLSRCAKEL